MLKDLTDSIVQSIGRALAVSRLQSEDKKYRQLVRQEAELGGRLFGPVPQGRARDFFCLDENTWVWHEKWQDQQGQTHTLTTRYELEGDKIIKAQDGQPYRAVTPQEADNLLMAIAWYYQLVMSKVYNR